MQVVLDRKTTILRVIVDIASPLAANFRCPICKYVALSRNSGVQQGCYGNLMIFLEAREPDSLVLEDKRWQKMSLESNSARILRET